MNAQVKRLDEAAEWMLRLQEDPAEGVIADWIKWCESDPLNQRSFDEVQALWQLTQGLAGEVRHGELTAAAPSVRPAPPSRSAPSSRRKPGSRSRQWLWAAAAGVLIILGAAVWTGFHRISNHTVIASQEPVRSTILPDGSRVELAAKSTVAVKYTDTTRLLELREGEAYFSVKADRERPFVVQAGSVRVRAIGTAFNVRRAGERIVITVTEGTVEVDRPGSDSRARVVAGRQLAVTTETQMAAPVVADAAAALAWREGRLEYVGEPLEGVVADVNRYAKRPVVIADEASKQLKFSGTVMVEYTNEWVRALPGEFPVRVEEQNGVDVIQAAR